MCVCVYLCVRVFVCVIMWECLCLWESVCTGIYVCVYNSPKHLIIKTLEQHTECDLQIDGVMSYTWDIFLCDGLSMHIWVGVYVRARERENTCVCVCVYM